MTSETIRSSFTMVAWGMVLALFDFHINGVVIVPDCIGYTLIAVGLGRVTALESRFQTCVTLAWILAPLSLTEYIHLFTRDLGEALLLMGLLGAMIIFALLLSLCSGVESVAQRAGIDSLMRNASTCRTLVIIYLIMMVCLLLVQSLRLTDLAWLVIPALLYSLFLIIMLFRMLTKAGRDLGAESLTT